MTTPAARATGCSPGTERRDPRDRWAAVFGRIAGYSFAVAVVRKAPTLIYYASDSWDRREAVVSPGCISRDQFETAGVIPIPGHHDPGSAGRLFFATREAAEDDLYRGQGERAERAGSDAPPVKNLRRAMAGAHPDRGGTAGQFIEARRRYETALRATAA